MQRNRVIIKRLASATWILDPDYKDAGEQGYYKEASICYLDNGSRMQRSKVIINRLASATWILAPDYKDAE